MSLSVSEAVSVELCYWEDRTSRLQAQDALDTFNKAFQCILRDPSQPVAAVERTLALKDAQNGEIQAPAEVSVAEMIREQVDRSPVAQALCSWDRELTYSQLDTESDKIAALLRSLGAGQDSPVVLCLARSSWTVVATLAALKSGAAFVPLEPTNPRQRTKHIIHSAGARLALVSPALAPKLDGLVPTIVSLSPQLLKSLPSPADVGLPIQVDMASAAYVIYTSGSTGTPKGVVVGHAALASSCSVRWEAMGFSTASRLLHFASAAFDVSIDEIILPLLAGGCVCVPSEDARRDHLGGAIAALQVNTAMLTPSVARTLLPFDTGLKTLALGGEKVEAGDIEAWIGRVRRLDIVYGPSECAIASTLYPNITGPRASGCLGRPIGCRIWLVDPADAHRLVPPGCVGEMLIEGPNLAAGYLHDPEKTAASFLSNLRWAPGSRVFFRTGDLARREADGVLRFFGRKDDQIKLRGLRIDPGEIEQHVIRRWPSEGGVQAVVDVVEYRGHKMLAAFVHVPAKTSQRNGLLLETCSTFENAALQVRDGLKSLLPSYMIPSIFIPLARVPVSASGKADRRCLKRVVEGQLEKYSMQQEVRTTPEGRTEQHLHDLWVQILQPPHAAFGREDNFFYIGGDSITAMRLAAAARASGYHLAVSDVFRHPVLSEMAKVMIRWSQGDVSKPEVTTLNTALLETTGFQAHCVTCQLQDPRAYSNYFFLDMDGPLDVVRLEAAIARLVARFPILRTAFIQSEQNTVQQIILKDFHPQLQRHTCGPGECLSTAANKLVEEIRRSNPFRWGKPSTQFILVQQEQKQRHRLIWHLSHAQYDGFCFPKLLAGLKDAYSSPSAATLLPSSDDFANFVTRALSLLPTAQRYWQQLLAGYHSDHPLCTWSPVNSELPASNAEPSRTRVGGIYPNSTQRYALPEPTCPGAAAASCSVTWATLVKSAWALTLARLSGTPDVVFGEVVSGRSAWDDGAVGPCMGYAPVRVALKPEWAGPEDVAAEVHAQFAAGLAFHACGGGAAAAFGSVVQFQSAQVSAGIAGELARGSPDGGLRFSGLSVYESPFRGWANLFVFVERDESAGQLLVEFSFSDTVFESSFVEREVWGAFEEVWSMLNREGNHK